MKKHTLVLHLSPDLEILFMVYLIRNFSAVREKLGIADRPKLKFIPAGKLRREDWSDHPDLDPAAIESDGYMFLDCGGGLCDQHDKQAVRNSMSSLDLLSHYCELDKAVPHLLPLVAVISSNDITGKDVVKDETYRRSSTPHTPRHMRNICLGWNLLHKDWPEMVVCLAETAFRGMAKLVERLIMESDERGETVRESEIRRLFLVDSVAQGVLLHHRSQDLSGQGDEAAGHEADKFRGSLEAALKAMENEWRRGVEDYWNRTTLVETTCARKIDGTTVYRQITVAYGTSESTRYGAVTRLGNEGPKDLRPHKSRPSRRKADVTIQFQGDGRFIVATKGIELDGVARLVRRSDLMRKGVELTGSDIQSLGGVGHLSFANRAGHPVQALYLAEYGTAFGNGFRANPHAEASSLSHSEIVKLVLEALKAA
jgi:hypothetical protein